MSFVSFQFAAFVLVCIVLYYVLPQKHRYLVLLAASYSFYLMACGVYIIYMLVTTVTTYGAGWYMDGIWKECDSRAKGEETGSKPERAEKKAIKARY
ncbi:MAG: hypothetical protein IJ641_02570, partial [Lachnospiraceae bacterium]|nr:hypothetical protein [Lachnospiraceae bacterium]